MLNLWHQRKYNCCKFSFIKTLHWRVKCTASYITKFISSIFERLQICVGFNECNIWPRNKLYENYIICGIQEMNKEGKHLDMVSRMQYRLINKHSGGYMKQSHWKWESILRCVYSANLWTQECLSFKYLKHKWKFNISLSHKLAVILDIIKNKKEKNVSYTEVEQTVSGIERLSVSVSILQNAMLQCSYKTICITLLNVIKPLRYFGQLLI
jgi:hypothetical protein